jgi:hypothetical protein
LPKQQNQTVSTIFVSPKHASQVQFNNKNGESLRKTAKNSKTASRLPQICATTVYYVALRSVSFHSTKSHNSLERLIFHNSATKGTE